MTPEGLLLLAAVAVSVSGGRLGHAKEKRGCERGQMGDVGRGAQRGWEEWKGYRGRAVGNPQELYMFGGW